MKKGNLNLWTLGVLFGSILAYTGWNGFETPTFLMGRTELVLGKIIETFPNREVQSHSRRVKYVYFVNGNYYTGFKKLGTKDAWQSIGNNIQLIYSKRNPKKNKVKKLLNQYKNVKEQRYYSNKENGFIELIFINGIFKYKEFEERGKLTNDFVGEYKILNDSVRFKNYLFTTESTNTNRPQLFIFTSDNHSQLLDTNSKRIFKKIRKE